MNNRPLICKVCGMRDSANIRQVAALGPDMMGFICWPGSPRHAGPRPMAATEGVTRVGVFVDQSDEEMAACVALHRLDALQLHGHETPARLERLRAMFPGKTIMKAIGIASETDLQNAAPYHGLCHLLLFDTRCTGMGGSGRKFCWQTLEAYEGPTPFLLSGGIGPDDAAAVAALSHPMMAGVDLNSRFETAPGMKDIAKLKLFFDKLNNIKNR